MQAKKPKYLSLVTRCGELEGLFSQASPNQITSNTRTTTQSLQHVVVSIYPTTQFTRLDQTSGFSATSNCTSFEVPSPHNKQPITDRPTQTNSETNNGTFSANAPLSPILGSQIDKNPKFEIKLSHLNIRSLKNRDHIIQLRLLVKQIKHEIITISETWLNSTVSNADIELEGYKILRLDRLGKAGGGLCMYYRNDLKVSLKGIV